MDGELIFGLALLIAMTIAMIQFAKEKEREKMNENSNSIWSTEWTGEYPCYCHGTWILYCNDKDVTVPIPFQGEPANTYGTYQYWTFTGEWQEAWYTYQDGLPVNQWIDEYKDYLSKVTEDKEEWPEIYWAFQVHDFRHGECGGCI